MTVLFDAATDHYQLLRDFRRTYAPCTQVIDGVTWSYLAGGVGATSIVFLPGVLGVADTSFHYLLAFAPQYRVRSLDYPPALRNVEQLLAGMATLLATAGLGAVHLVGGSYSGPIAHHFAQRYPAQVASLVFSNTGLPDGWRLVHTVWLMGLVGIIPSRLLPWGMCWSMGAFLGTQTGLEGFWRTYFYALLPYFTRQVLWSRGALLVELARRGAGVSQWSGPTLIVEAQGDTFFSRGERAALRAAYPQADLVTIAATGHGSALKALDRHIAVYGEFWAQVEKRSSRRVVV